MPLGPIPLSIGRKIRLISFFGIQKEKEDIFHEDMFLYALVQSGEYDHEM